MINCFFFFFNDTATTEIYTLSLHDALPICGPGGLLSVALSRGSLRVGVTHRPALWSPDVPRRSEEHTSELQSRQYLVCRLLLEKKKKQNIIPDLDDNDISHQLPIVCHTLHD